MFRSTRSVKSILILTLALLMVGAVNSFAYRRDQDDKAREGIEILRSKQLPTSSDMQVVVSVLCIDGFKYVQVISTTNDKVSTDLVQMYIPAEEAAVPDRCK